MFKLTKNDEISLENYNCAYKDRFILYGILYIYNTKLCFHSKFNRETLIGGNDTIIIIEYENIV